MDSQTVKPMLVSLSNAYWKSGDGISDQFPVGLRVLVVDDDTTCLKILDSMLKKCGYEVTQKSDAESALDLLRKNKNGYDIVISDVHMPDMDGFKLLEHIGHEMDLPVIMMSADDSKDVVLKGVNHGACDYLIKPISIEALMNIWQHVVRKRKQELKEKDFEGSGISEDGEQQQKSPENFDYSSSANEANYKNLKKRKDEEDEEERDDTSTLKKPRVVWSTDLHQQFVNAVHQLGIEKAVPKKILELMNVPGLTRENVASHLQKFRLYLKRASQHQSGHNNAFMGPQEASFGPISSINGLNLHALTTTGQIPAQSLAIFQAAALGRPTTTSVPIVDQRNIFSFGTPKLTSGDDQQQPNNNIEQMNLFHRIPSSMEPKQLATLNPFAQSSGGMNMQVDSPAQMGQPQRMTQVFHDINGGSHVSCLASSVGQPNLLQVIPSGVHGPSYSSVSQPSTPPGDSFTLMSNSGLSTLTSKGMLQEEVNSEMKGSRGFVSNYVVCGGLGNSPNTIQLVNSSLADNALRIKNERLADMDFQNNPFPGQFSEEDLISALLKQPEDFGLVENEFNFDGYHPNNLPL